MKTKEVNKEKFESFIIANPIYDTVFKRLMENQRIVKFFLGTILEQQIEEVSFLPQEFTYVSKGVMIVEKMEKMEEIKGSAEHFSIFRLDFIATVRTRSGRRKKILIEVQKSWDTMDVMRFRKYLGEQYGRKEIIDGKETVMPVTTIYILGNNLPEINCPCIKIGRVSTDMRNHETINETSEFIELLTHDSYVIQAGRITDVRYATNLDRLLSIFEQNYFVVKGSDLTKKYRYLPGDENMKLIVDILQEMALNSEKRKEIEDEREALRTFNNAFDAKNKIIEEKDKTIEEKDKALEEKDKTIEEKDKTIAEDKKVIEEQAKVHEEDKKTIKEQKEMIKQLIGKLNRQDGDKNDEIKSE
ncbi:MAG: hypothetical protein LBK96_05570 [Prevotellaceae bacterium]|jgi:hypothetical protein|nr:hypothetical protein [Prevotellaceae bacterium]